MKLYAARHGKTDANAEDLIDLNAKLNDEGLGQAQSLRKKLGETAFQLIFVSELPRTLQTAEIINQDRGASVVVDNRLNEIITGFEGQRLRAWDQALDSSEDAWTARFNLGQSKAEKKWQVAKFLNNLKLGSEQSALVITSRFPLQYIIEITHDLPDEAAANLIPPQGDFISIDY